MQQITRRQALTTLAVLATGAAVGVRAFSQQPADDQPPKETPENKAADRPTAKILNVINSPARDSDSSGAHSEGKSFTDSL